MIREAEPPPSCQSLSLIICTQTAIAKLMPHTPIIDALMIQNAVHCAEFISFPLCCIC